MLPGMGGRGMNPKKVAAMMKQMGIEMEDIDDVEEVVIRTKTKEYVFRDATVSKMTARGEVTWQLMGTPKITPRAAAATPASAPVQAPPSAPAAPAPISDADVELVASQSKVSKQRARQALVEANGEPAEAIVKLTEENEDVS